MRAQALKEDLRQSFERWYPAMIGTDVLPSLAAKVSLSRAIWFRSIAAKATLKRGPFARGGNSRVPTKAADHDFRPEQTRTPLGMRLPAEAKLLLRGVPSRVPSACVIDPLEAKGRLLQPRFPQGTTLVLNLNHGPEGHARRSQFLPRLVRFAAQSGLPLTLAAYPPYPRKSNPIERCWGMLERRWNGSLLDSRQGTLAMLETMTLMG